MEVRYEAVTATKILCEETVRIKPFGLKVKYIFTECKANNSTVYSFTTELYENNVLKGSATRSAGEDLGKAIKLYGMLIKNKVTPIGLEYVIEDFLSE